MMAEEIIVSMEGKRPLRIFRVTSKNFETPTTSIEAKEEALVHLQEEALQQTCSQNKTSRRTHLIMRILAHIRLINFQQEEMSQIKRML
jgi:hypothetical protein